MAQYEPAHRIHMLARYPVVVYPFPFAVELHEREPPEFRVQDVAYEAPEPRGAYPVSYTHLDVYKRQGELDAVITVDWKPTKK